MTENEKPVDAESALVLARRTINHEISPTNGTHFELARRLHDTAFALLVLQQETGKRVFVSQDESCLRAFTVRDAEEKRRADASKDFDEPGREHTAGDALGLRRMP